jgi:hypothetical protein
MEAAMSGVDNASATTGQDVRFMIVSDARTEPTTAAVR